MRSNWPAVAAFCCVAGRFSTDLTPIVDARTPNSPATRNNPSAAGRYLAAGVSNTDASTSYAVVPSANLVAKTCYQGPVRSYLCLVRSYFCLARSYLSVPKDYSTAVGLLILYVDLLIQMVSFLL
jgi:hypothetical protein